MVVTARRALVDDELVEHVAFETNAEGVIEAIRPVTAADPPAAEGLVVAGLVNAHLHLELSAWLGQVPGGQGLFPWVGALRSQPPASDPGGAAVAAARSLRGGGTAMVCDISNQGHTGAWLAEAGLAGVVQHEQLGMHGPSIEERVARGLQQRPRWDGAVVTRPSPHAVYSTPGPLIQATARPMEGAPASIHLSEDEAEEAFLRDGRGPVADLLDRLELDWSWYGAPGCSPAAWLERLGVLGPDLLLVHGVHLSADDRELLHARKAPLCLCPRSNLHIGGQLPDVPSLLDSGVSLALGTDSLASCPDLDVLGEVAALTAAFPEVPALRWLVMATAGGADALGWRGAGRLCVGAAPGLLLLEGVQHPADLAHVPHRRWLVAPRPSRGVPSPL